MIFVEKYLYLKAQDELRVSLLVEANSVGVQ